MRARFWAWLLAVGVLCAPTLASARVPTRLVYSRTPAASDCPDEAALAAAVAARLGYEPFSPWGDQTILATVTRRGSELIGRAELIDHDGIAQGSREVKLGRAECGELLLALALAISITLDPLHVDTPAPAEPEAVPVPVPETQPEPTAPPVVAVEPRPAGKPLARDSGNESESPSLSWHATAAAIGALETAPQPALGGRLGVAVRRERWSLGVEGWSTLPAAGAATDGGEVRVRLISAALVPCFQAWRPLSLCALGALGAFHAEGRGIDDSRAENVLYAAAGARALLAFPLGERFELLANADLAAALNRPRFQLDQRDVWRPGPLVALFGVGVGARFF
jgi:hypothetical protein